MSVRIRNILLLLLILLMGGYILFSLVYFPGRGNDAVCNEVVICIKDSSELRFVNEKYIHNLLEQNDLNPVGKSIGDIPLERIERRLLRHPAVRRAKCYRTPSNMVRIDIYQRHPIFRVMGENANYYIDSEAQKMPVPRNFAANVPVVTGVINYDFLTSELFDFVVFLRKSKFWDAQIEQINICPGNKIELVPRVGNHIIYLGSLDRYEQKMEKLRKFYRKSLASAGWNRYSRINLEYKNQIVCKKIVQ